MPLKSQNTKSIEDFIINEQVRVLYNNLPVTIATNLILAVLMLLVLWDVAGSSKTTTWSILLFIVLVYRAVIYILHRRQLNQTIQNSVWLHRFRIGAIATGVAWGLAGILLFPHHQIEYQVFLAFVLAGISAGAIASLSPDRISTNGFVISALSPAVGNFYLEVGQMTSIMGTMIALFMVYISSNANRVQSQFRENINLRMRALENEETLKQQQALGDIIASAQALFIQANDRNTVFDQILSDILTLTESEYGFIGEILQSPEGAPYLKSYALTNIAWNDATRKLYESNTAQGMEFHNLKSLFGTVMTSGEVVIANNPAKDPRSGGLPEGHPALNAFLGLPIRHAGELVGIIGVANRKEGYDASLAEFLRPILAVTGQLVAAIRTEQRSHAIQVELARLSKVASQTTNGVVITDAKGHVEWINDGFTRMTGYTLSDLLDRRPGELLQGKDSDPVIIQHMHEALINEQPFDVDIINYTKASKPFWNRISCNPLKDRHGNLTGFMAIESDISAQKNAETAIKEQAQFMNAVVENMVDGIITIDRNGTIVSFNKAAEQIFGYSSHDAIGQNVKMLMPKPDRDQHDSYIRNYQSTGIGQIIGIGREVQGLRKDGGTFPMELAISEISRQGQSYYVGIVRDITERKRVDRMASEFVSTVSHELRTPLTSISGSLSLISSGTLGSIPESAKEMLTIALKNSHRLASLINDLLDMEKLDAGKMRFDMQVHDVVRLVTQSVRDNQGYADQYKVRFELDNQLTSANIKVDAQRTQQILANLLSNAAKFSPTGGTVEIVTRRHGEFARVEVIDHGPGVPATFRDRVFRKFAQADSSDTRQKGGTGLGLAISRELTERMNGNIGYETTEGNGATFYFEFPIITNNTQMKTSQSDANKHEWPLVLVAQGDADVARLLDLILTRAEFAVEMVTTGAATFHALNRKYYNAIMLDVMMPDINGLEIIRRIRQNPATVDLPIILFSAKMEDGRLSLSDSFAGIEWLAKPVDKTRLLKVMEKELVNTDSVSPRVLHIEDDDEMHRVVHSIAGDRFEFDFVTDLAEARQMLSSERYDLIILDLLLPDESGWNILPDIRALQPNAHVMILSGAEITAEDVHRVASATLKLQITPRELIDVLRKRVRK